MAVQWTQDLSVGVNEIDSQHKELFVRVNSLFDAMKEGKGRDEISRVVKFLEDYVVSHFGAEEKYMARYSYDGLAVHKVQHDAFVKDFLDIKKTLESAGATSSLVIQTQRRVNDWLLGHIGKTDKALGEFLSKKLPN